MKRVKKTHILFFLAASAVLAGCDTAGVSQDSSEFEAPTITTLDNVNI
ncbi:hypothetical protein C8N43_1818 [Litoreibacter ponti]|uniref:Lipoprotein n=1 Tax=Litoreibacter ponti TaxID=1510457 RepID=A0A2T6BM78_9RHOB|nr:hypothetical protein [Litoreibacter ponti]PTX57152.1 hypothetical protein C8N43_1818 [Litoreibacter ponti]